MNTTAATLDDIAVVRSGYDAVASGDLPGFAGLFHGDATWNHRNDDELGGTHRGLDAILAFIGASVERTAGTLRVVAQNYCADGDGHVAVVARVSASRPDGRTFDDQQCHVFTVEDGRVRHVDQFIGDPAAVTAFWA